jgi:hypothetical protein
MVQWAWQGVCAQQCELTSKLFEMVGCAGQREAQSAVHWQVQQLAVPAQSDLMHGAAAVHARDCMHKAVTRFLCYMCCL